MPKIKVDASKGLNQFTGAGYVLTPATIAAPAAAAAGSTNTLTQAALTIVTPTNNADDRVYLPSPTECDLGQVITLAVGATGFELCSKDDGVTATTINGVAVTDGAGNAAKELAVAAQSLLTCVKIGDNAWLCGDPDAGTPDAV